MHARLTLLSTAAAVALLAAPALAQQNPTATPMTANPSLQQPAVPTAGGQKLSAGDQKFAKEAAIGGMTEVALGKLAQQNGQSDQVKQFGARMVQDHGKANDELQSIAASHDFQLPQQPDKKDQALQDKLERLQGAAFDRAYMSAMVKDHNADMKAFRREAQKGRDPALKQFAEKTLQTIEQHDQLAKNVDRSLTATGSSRPPRR